MKIYAQTVEEIRLEIYASFVYQIGLLQVTALLSVLTAHMLLETQGLALAILDGRRPTVIHHAIAFATPACRRMKKHVQNALEIRPYRTVTFAFSIGSATSVKLDVLMEHMFPEVQGSALVPQDGLASLAKSRAILIASLVLKLMKTYVQTAEEIRLEMNVSFAYQIGLLRVTALLSVLMALMLKVTQGLALVILDGRRPTVIHHAIAFAIPACRRIQKHVQNVPEIRPYRNVTCAFLIGSMTIVKLCAMRVKAFTYMVLVASVPA